MKVQVLKEKYINMCFKSSAVFLEKLECLNTYIIYLELYYLFVFKTCLLV